MDDRELYEEGMKVRCSVLGDAHVDQSCRELRGT